MTNEKPDWAGSVEYMPVDAIAPEGKLNDTAFVESVCSFIRRKMDERSAKDLQDYKQRVLERLPKELPIPEDPPYTDSFEWDKGYNNAIRQARQVIEETLV